MQLQGDSLNFKKNKECDFSFSEKVKFFKWNIIDANCPSFQTSHRQNISMRMKWNGRIWYCQWNNSCLATMRSWSWNKKIISSSGVTNLRCSNFLFLISYLFCGLLIYSSLPLVFSWLVTGWYFVIYFTKITGDTWYSSERPQSVPYSFSSLAYSL